ncbi:MAG: HIT domain-containing protein [Bifidobacteriaceae bacterium]|jgi:ATP adenylyltransferase|nr:HIT domain-containing protein [Bifidobacteriaceae bacterium]
MVESSAAFAGQPDGYERLWTPHRMAYVDGDARPRGDSAEDCPFCLAVAKPDEEALIVARGQSVYAIMNLFPYNPGHLLVCPYRHVSALTDLTAAEAGELMEFARQGIAALTRSKHPGGFNLGINQGAVAGAGIAAHLHQHIVPRWPGDSNFFPVVARSRALPELLADTRQALASAWEEA